MCCVVLQVETVVGSMNKGDCFILDCGATVYVYMGPGSRRIERLKAITAGNAVRDDDHAGKAKVIIIGEQTGHVYLYCIGWTLNMIVCIY